MNRLVLAFGIVCFLQGLSAEPRPEFGLSVAIPASSRITSVTSDVSTIKDEIKAILPIPTINSGLTKLVTTKEKLEEIINSFDAKTSAILSAYDGLVSATANSGSISNAFTPFISAITDAQSLILSDGSGITSALSSIMYTGISDQVSDAFMRIVNGLADLKTKTETVQSAIEAAVTSAGSASSVTENSLRQFVTLKMVYDLLKSATALRTYLPLVTYILKTAKENVIEADTFVVGLTDALNTDVNAIINSFTSGLDAKTTEIENDVAGRFASDATLASGINTQFGSLTGIVSASAYGSLLSQISALNNMFTVSSLSANTAAMSAAFDSISSALRTLITNLQGGASVTDNALVNSLVDTLVGNDEYGRYCYHKYKYIVEGLFDQSFDAGWQCIDKELIRLEHLRVTLNLIIDLLTADFDDIMAQVGICNQLTSLDNLNTCVSGLAGFYNDLFGATRNKIAAVFKLATDEAVAVENRLLICFELVNLDTSITQVAAISAKLAICSANGPNGSD